MGPLCADTQSFVKLRVGWGKGGKSQPRSLTRPPRAISLTHPRPNRITREGHTQHGRPTGRWTPRAGPGRSDQAQAWTANCGLPASHALPDEVHPPWPMSLTPRNLGRDGPASQPQKTLPAEHSSLPSLSKHQVLSKVMRC